MRLILGIVLFLAAGVFLGGGVGAESSNREDAGVLVPSAAALGNAADRGLIVRFRAGARAASALSPYRNVSAVRSVHLNPFGWGFTLVVVEEGTDLGEALEMLARDPLVLDVWPDVIRTTSFIPNDPKYFNNRDEDEMTPDRQYYMDLMKAPGGWDVTTGSESVVIAMIDTGIEMTHVDLFTQLWENPGEVPENGEDDDGNGYVDDFNGYDFYFEDGDPADDEESTGYHGTSTAGLAGAGGDNGRGIMGAAGGRGAAGEMGARLMILRVGTDFSIKLSSEIEAIAYAIENGAHVINMSFGGPSGGSVERDAVNAAWDAGLVIVAAAGNEGAGAPAGAIDWPAAIESAIAVGSTTIYPGRQPQVDTTIIDEAIADYSKVGAEIELVAPGTALVTTSGDNRYTRTGGESFTGTSASSPLVSGLAALLFSADPTISNAEVRTIMQDTAEDFGLAGRDEFYGYGRVDFEAALTASGKKIPGDANRDGVIDEFDVDAVVDLFGVQIGDTSFIGAADTNRDGIIDELDLFAIGANFGLSAV